MGEDHLFYNPFTGGNRQAVISNTGEEPTRQAITPKDCKRFETCDANICPLDERYDKRTWIIGEDICGIRAFKDHPIIKRQKQLNRLKPAVHLGEALSGRWLEETSGAVSKPATPKQLEALKKGQFKRINLEDG